MQRRKQSVITLSFEDSPRPGRGYFSKLEPESENHQGGAGELPSAGGAALKGELPADPLMDLCKEIAGALLCHYSHEDEAQKAQKARKQIHRGLMKTVRCDSFQADRLIDLSLELIHVESYGRYRRNPLELSLLIAQASGQQWRGIDN